MERILKEVDNDKPFNELFDHSENADPPRLREPTPLEPVRWLMERALLSRIEGLARVHGCGITHFLLTLLALYFSRMQSREDEVVIGLERQNRRVSRQRSILSPCVSVAPVSICLSQHEGFVANMHSVAAELKRVDRRDWLAPSAGTRLHEASGVSFDVRLLVDDTVPGGPPSTQGPVLPQPGFASAPLALVLRRCGQRKGDSQWVLEFHHSGSALDRAWAARVQQRLALLSRTVVERHKTPVSQIPLMSHAERQQMLVAWNDTRRAYPQGLCVHERFEQQAARTPEAVAAEQGDQRLTYQALNEQANRLAHHLRTLGVGPDERVAICLTRGPLWAVAMLAVLKAGGAYVPLDPAYPPVRLNHWLLDSAPRVLLTQAVCRARLRALENLTVLDLDDTDPVWATQPAGNLEPALLDLTSRHLAYVIYTSGSTGEPKGVMVEHGNLGNLIAWHGESFPLQPGARSSCMAGLGFDASAWEVWPALCMGATLVWPPAAVAANATQLLDWWAEQDLHSSYLVTALAEEALSRKSAPRSLRTLLIGGDRLRRSPPEGLSFAVINNYGPTEATVVATSGLSRPQDKVKHIGRPIANTKLYLLDRRGQPVPVGVAGEICIGGAGVARGYLNRPELTRAHFMADPFSSEPGARMYKSGDLGRWLPDGTVEFLGRNDLQVKIRGLRVEPGEIEAQLHRLPGVREAVVLVREDAPGDRRVVAYVVSEGALDVQSLRQALARELPEPMVPGAYVPLASLPLTPNGKLDRQALPVPGGLAYTQPPHEAAQGPVENALAQLWRTLLCVDRVGRHDNFFELGGNSMLAVQLLERMRQQQLHTDIRNLWSCPTVAGLAQVVVPPGPVCDGPEPACGIAPSGSVLRADRLPLVTLDAEQIERIVRAVPGGATHIQDIYPLAPLQERLLGCSPLSTLLTFNSRARLDGFVQALQEVIERHDALRTAVWSEGLTEPVQVVWRQARIEVDMAAVGDAEGDTAALLRAQAGLGYPPLDLRQAPPMRGHAAYDAQQQRWLLLLLHHPLMVDAVSSDLLTQELAWIQAGRRQDLPPPVPFRNYVAQARRGVSMQEHAAYFRQMLGDMEEPTVPFAFGQYGGHGDRQGVQTVQRLLDPQLSQRIRHQSRALGVSAASVFHWAWAQVLARTTGREDVVFGSVLSGRLQGGGGTDQMVGLCINAVPMRLKLGNVSVQDSVRQTHEALAGLVWHAHAPLALAQRCSALPPSVPLFSALLNYHCSSSAADPVLSCMKSPLDCPLNLSVENQGGEFRLQAQVALPIDAQRVCDYVQHVLECLVDALEHAPQTPAWRIDVMSPAERHQVLVVWNDVQRGRPPGLFVHQRFEQQAARTPQAVAVTQDGLSLSYQELNERASRLAHYLRTLGVGPEERVAICVQRGPGLIVGMLAVLKAGGAYVPLDPACPRERLGALLRDSAPRVLLTQTGLRPGLPALPDLKVLELDGERPAWRRRLARNLDPFALGLMPRHLVYVIYPSGSCGQPTGVMVEHGNLDNLVAWHCENFPLRPGERTACMAGLGFDAFTWEVWPALCMGATLVLPPAAVTSNPVRLLDWWEAQDLHSSFLVTALAEAMLGRDLTDRPLRTLLTGGDRLSKRPSHGQPFALVNNYGPTEATVVATSGVIHPDDPVVHIGRPIANTRLYLLDGHGQPVPVGVVGEICIGGAGVARGYLNQPELTQQRFVADPFAGDSGARMYKTGDLGRWLSTGTVELLGRNDQQVKIRGMRIDPEEIEAQLLRQSGVREAAVLACEDRPGHTQLVAYVAGDSGLDMQNLREALASTLPNPSVPAAWMAVDHLPLTSRGKLDRAALPAPEPLPRPRWVPLSSAQQGVWSLVQGRAEGGAACHRAGGLRLHGVLDEGALQAALDCSVQRHEVLRTHIEVAHGEPMQCVDGAGACVLVRHDLRVATDPQGELTHWRTIEACRPFDLRHGPLVRGRLLRLGEQDHVLLLTMHALVADSGSLGIWMHELGVCYGAYTRQGMAVGSDPLPPLAAQYADHVLWQRNWLSEVVQAQQLAYWQRQLAGAPALITLPSDWPRPAVPDHAGACLGFELDATLSRALKELSHRHGTTVSMTLLAAWGALAARLAGQSEVMIGTPVANRMQMASQPLIGCFVNTVALRLNLGGRPRVSDVLAQVRERMLQAQSHADVPFAQVVRALDPAPTPTHSPIFQLLFKWQPRPQPVPALEALRVQSLPEEATEGDGPRPRAWCDLSLNLQQAGDCIVGHLVYATALYERGTMQRHLGHLKVLLQGMVQDDTQVMERVNIVDEAERRQMPVEVHDAQRAYLQRRCLHELFEQQVARTPQAAAVAVAHAGQCLSYQALNEQANRLAHYLRMQGVGPDERVAICLPRCLERVVGVLAILKAGGAYVPLDPGSPWDRLGHVLRDSASRFMMTLGRLDVPVDLTLLPLDGDTRAWAMQPACNLDRRALGLTPRHLACVIYPAHASDPPKGVVLEHRTLCTQISAGPARDRLRSASQMAPPAVSGLDGSLDEMFSALLSGATLVLRAEAGEALAANSTLGRLAPPAGPHRRSGGRHGLSR